jgi:diamine N-acetyltransferase
MGIVRRAAIEDAKRLSEFAERCFRETFASANTAEDMELYCKRSFSPTIQADEIQTQGARMLLMEDAGELRGYAYLRRSPLPDSVGDPASIELVRFYLDGQWHGHGLARRLLAAVLVQASEVGAGFLWLAVWEHNTRAYRFYQRCGFQPIGDKLFVLGTDPQRDVIMSRSLEPLSN